MGVTETISRFLKKRGVVRHHSALFYFLRLLANKIFFDMIDLSQSLDMGYGDLNHSFGIRN